MAQRLDERISPEQIEALVREHEAGLSVGEIARGHELTEYAVKHVLRRAGRQLGPAELTKDEIVRACQLYGSGLSIKTCAERLGRSYSSVHKMLVGAGVELQPSRRPFRLDDAELAIIRERHGQGESATSLSKVFGTSPDTVRRALARRSVPTQLE